jgi:hypothetical protein
MTGQRAAEPSAWGEGRKTLMKRSKRPWTLLTAEDIFYEDGTSARQTMVRRAIRSKISSRESSLLSQGREGSLTRTERYWTPQRFTEKDVIKHKETQRRECGERQPDVPLRRRI